MPPLPAAIWSKVTQAYGTFDCVNYPLTCRHIGTDFLAPLNTPLTMPVDGAVRRSGYSAALGFWCEVTVDDWFMVCLHLKARPLVGLYKQGQVFARIGASGKEKGIHSHLEAWHEPMDRNKLNKTNWAVHTFDITTKFTVV